MVIKMKNKEYENEEEVSEETLEQIDGAVEEEEMTIEDSQSSAEKSEETTDDATEETEVKEKKEKTPKQIKGINDLPGVGAATAEKLIEGGFETLMAIGVASVGELVEASGLSEAKVRKIIKASRDSLNMGFESGIDVMKRREKVEKIKTGSETFDKIMGGGFETGSITEAFGEFGSGKTQIAHMLAVNLQKQDPTAMVVYIDTENTFRPERIKQLAAGAGLDADKVLKNILVAKAYNSDHQMLLAEKVNDLIDNQGLNVKLVVVDSLIAHFRAEFIGRGTLAERQQKLNKHMHVLSKLADTKNVCVFVTNQVMTDPGTFFGDPIKAIGGNIVGHTSTFRIYIRKGRKGSRVAKLIDSPNLPEAESNFFVTEGGLKDV